MAKVYLDRLRKKYNLGANEITGYNYQLIMRDIIANQTENVANAIGRLSKSNYERQLEKVSKTGKKINLPDISEVLPKRSIFLRKAAQESQIITETLRSSLTKNLRDTLNDFKTKTGKPAYLRQAGEMVGTINPKVVDLFKKQIINTYTEYTKKDPSIGMPKNIHAIAVTEIRSTINPIKEKYNQEFYNRNRDKVKGWKVWVQNKSLAKVPRPGHSEVNGKKIDMDGFFLVPVYKLVKKVWKYVRQDFMRHPHDPEAAADQVITCSCECLYFFQLL